MAKLAPLVVIVGPTASGKSALAMQISQQFNGEIICADSRTVYKGLDIGTAKPSAEDRRLVPHHLLDLVEPNQRFTAAQFKRLAIATIDDVWQRGKLPVIVGGTGLYIDAVLFDYEFGPPANIAARAKLEKLSVPELQEICRKRNIDLPYNLQNKRHLVRTLELAGKTPKRTEVRTNTLVVGLSTEKSSLQEKIHRRAEHMFASGVRAEAQSVADRYGWEAEALTGNIYRVVHRLLKGELTQEEALEQVVRSDLSLVKRQITWFKRNPAIKWGTAEQLIRHIETFTKTIPTRP